MLLDDVMSELDPDRRALLAACSRARARASSRRPTSRTSRAPTTPAVARLAVADGAVLQDAVAA